MSKILEKLADQHEERIINVLYKLEEDVVKEVTRATKGQLVSQRLAIQLRPAIKKLIDESFLDEADTIINQEYNKIAKEVLDRFGEMPIPSKFKSLTEVDLRTINALKYQSFSGFEDIAERFLKVINDEVYQSTIAGRPFEDMVSNIRSHINGVYKSSNSAEINELVDFINENKFDNAKKAQVEEAVRKLHTQYASDRAGNNLRRYASQIAHDSVMQFHGQFTVAKAKEAGLTHYTYTGTLVRDSREFCVEMLNRTLTEEQIREMWNRRAWQGKSTGDPFIVRGGYRCRHTWLPTDPAWGEETVDDLPTEEEVPPPPPPRTTVSDVSIGGLLTIGDKAKRDAYDVDFNSQLTNQQKRIAQKFDKPRRIKDHPDGYYQPTTGTLSAEFNAKYIGKDGKEFKNPVISHEYGHHIDYVSNKSKLQTWSEVNKDFNKAISDDLKLYEAKRVFKGRPILKTEEYEKFHKTIFTTEIREIYSKEDPRILLSRKPKSYLKAEGYDAISDIVDALSKGTFFRDFDGVYGHGVAYYRQRGNVQAEIFANLFSIRNNKKAYNLAKSIIPNTVREFEKRLDELDKMEL